MSEAVVSQEDEIQKPFKLNSNSGYTYLEDKIQSLSNEPLERVGKNFKQRHDLTEEELEKIKIAFLRFAFLNFINDTTKKYEPPKIVGEFWGFFVRHTKHYKSFCQRHFEQYWDHTPPEDYEKKQENIERTRAMIRKLYPDYNEQIWDKGYK